MNGQPWQGQSILVVEDDASIREILEEILAIENHQAALVADGEAAVDYLDQNTYDILISDLGLPGIDGWKVIEHARRRNYGIGVIAITSWQDKKTVARMKIEHVDFVLWKPFRFGQLKNALNFVIGRMKHA